MKLRMLITLVSLGLLTACYYDNEEELYGNDCDTQNMSYATDIQPIIETNCYVCHSASANLGNVTLEGYGALKTFVDNGRLVGAINHLDGYSAMPENAPKLSDCSLDRIQSWIDNGAPNN